MWVVVRADGVQQVTPCDKAALGNVAFTDNHLPGVGVYLVRVSVEIARHAVHLQHLIHVSRNDAVVIPLFGKVGVIIERTPVCQLQGSFDIPLNRALVGREGEEQLMKTLHVFPCLHRTVLRQILREGEHQRFTAVQHVNLLPLRFGKRVGTPYGVTRDCHADHQKDDAEQPYLPETALDVF